MKQVSNKRFYSFEGIDYSGKSTQIELLRKFLESKGHQVYVLREPGGTGISEKIRDLLLDKKYSNMTDICEIFLYSAARTQLVQEKIVPLLQQNYFVIADRYVDSTTAYQGFGRGIDEKIVEQINRFATDGLMPQTTFLMNVTPEISIARRRKSGRSADRLEESGKAFFNRVYQGYQQLALENKSRYVVLEAEQPKDFIHQQIIKIVLSREI